MSDGARVDGPRIAGLSFCERCGWSPQFCRCDDDGVTRVPCTCADVAPTMPTYRTEHLSWCPIARFFAITKRASNPTQGEEG